MPRTLANLKLPNSDICKILFAVIFPPLGVFLEVGCTGKLCLNIVLTLCGKFSPSSAKTNGAPEITCATRPHHSAAPSSRSLAPCASKSGLTVVYLNRLHPRYYPRTLHHLQMVERPSHSLICLLLPRDAKRSDPRYCIACPRRFRPLRHHARAVKGRDA